MGTAPKILLHNNGTGVTLASLGGLEPTLEGFRGFSDSIYRTFMALGLALTGLTHKTQGKKLWTLKTVSWWDELELIRDRRFSKLDLGPDKQVHEAILTVEETWKLHTKYKNIFLQVFEEEPIENPYRQERMKLVDELENKFKNPKLRFVNVWLFDWDY